MQRVLDFRFILLYVQYVYKLIEDFTIKNETHSMTAIESYLQKSDRSFENNYLDPVYVVHCLFLTEEAWSHGVSDQGSLAKPLLILAWVTNVSTSPDLYIEFSTEY